MLTLISFICYQGKVVKNLSGSIVDGAFISLMMYSDPEDLRERASWDGSRGSSRLQLLSDLHSKDSLFPFKSFEGL